MYITSEMATVYGTFIVKQALPLLFPFARSPPTYDDHVIHAAQRRTFIPDTG